MKIFCMAEKKLIKIDPAFLLVRIYAMAISMISK